VQTDRATYQSNATMNQEEDSGADHVQVALMAMDRRAHGGGSVKQKHATIMMGNTLASRAAGHLGPGGDSKVSMFRSSSFFMMKTCINEINALVTGSWDKTMKYWDMRAPKEQGSVPLPERVYAMDVKYPLAVVGTAERHVLIYDLRKHQTPFRTFASPLKMQTRCLATFVTGGGFAIGSIEGRIAIQHIEEKDASRNFAFKCHRNNNEVYAVNSLTFHKYGTFATAGSDGVYTFWDKDSRQRLKIFQRNSLPITTGAFNRDGSIYAYACGYDWSKGHEFHDRSKPNKIFLHAVTDAEIKPK